MHTVHLKSVERLFESQWYWFLACYSNFTKMTQMSLTDLNKFYCGIFSIIFYEQEKPLAGALYSAASFPCKKSEKHKIKMRLNMSSLNHFCLSIFFAPGQ